MRTVDFSQAFPTRTTIEPYLAIVDAAGKVTKGNDGRPRVIVEDYDTAQLANKAARTIRNYSQNHHLSLHVTCPEGSREIKVYKGTPRASARKKDAAQPVESDTE
jgi:hypothetical protein